MPKKNMTPADEGIRAAQNDANAIQEPDIPDILVEITHIPAVPDGKLHAYARLNISGLIEIDGLRIMDGKNGLFASMPARKGGDDKYHSIVRITDDDLKQLVQDAAVGAYQAHVLELAQHMAAEPEMEMGL